MTTSKPSRSTTKSPTGRTAAKSKATGASSKDFKISAAEIQPEATEVAVAVEPITLHPVPAEKTEAPVEVQAENMLEVAVESVAEDIVEEAAMVAVNDMSTSQAGAIEAEMLPRLDVELFEPEPINKPVGTPMELMSAAIPAVPVASSMDTTSLFPSTPSIDIVTGTTGGVGKTEAAHLLTSYYFKQMLNSGNLQPINLVEGDHTGTKFFQTYRSLPAPFTLMVNRLEETILSDDPAKQSNADFVVQLALESSSPVVVNMPANSTEAMSNWLLSSDIPALCQAAGVPLRYWFVCKNLPDSLNAFSQSFQHLGSEVDHILIKNQFGGQHTQSGYWDLPANLQTIVALENVPVVEMPALFVQNQSFGERFYLPFEVALSYDPDSFTLDYWQKRVAAADSLITRWLEWNGGTVEEFLNQWQTYWKSKELLYTGTGAKQEFMSQHDIPLGLVGRSRLSRFLSTGYDFIAQALA